MGQCWRGFAVQILLTIVVVAAGIGAAGVAAAVGQDIAALEHAGNQPEWMNRSASEAGSAVIIEIAPDSLPAVATWTRFNEDGSLSVYGVFENNSDRPVTVDRHTAEFYTACGRESQRWHGVMDTEDKSISIADLEQATVTVVGEGYFSDERSQRRGPVGTPGLFSPSKPLENVVCSGAGCRSTLTQFDGDDQPAALPIDDHGDFIARLM